MRLIDADALTEDFKGRIADCDKWIKEASEEIKPRAEATRAFINEVILTIKDAPTIEPDRPHGEWVESKERKSHFYCSECVQEDAAGKWRELFDYKYNFCPNCGSDNRKRGDPE